jgi:GTP-binding protein
MKRGKKKRLKPFSPNVGGGALRYPFVAIVGRPNVGKSTLFNRFVGQRLAIEEPTAGTTRDRLAALVEFHDGRAIEVCDMGGLGGTGDPFDADVNTQINLAMDFADLILLLTDAREGMTPQDEEIARRVKRLGKPVVVAANKCETLQLEALAGEFYALGFDGEVHVVSAREGTGKSDLLEAIVAKLDEHRLFEVDEPVEPEESEQEPGEPEQEPGETPSEPLPKLRPMRLAVLGRRNVGKSTFVNEILGEERVIASDTPGTTRDAIDVRVRVGDEEVILIDTAGVRKRGRADDQIELISHGRARLALRRSDATLLFLDALADVRNLDRKLGGMILEEYKACVIVANKWDLVTERMSVEDFSDYCAKVMPHLSYAPVVGISALEGTNAESAIEVALDLYRQSMIRVGTGKLNRALASAVTLRRPKPVKNVIGKLFFGTQIATNPVTILLFVNDPMLFPRSYRRFLTNHLRKQLPWEEIPVKLVFRARQSLYRKGGGLKDRVKRMGGLADQARWVEDRPSANVKAIEDTLDLQEVKAVLLDTFAHGDEDEDPLALEPVEP